MTLAQQNRSCKQIFSHLTQNLVESDERARTELSGIIADLLVDFISLAAPAPDGLEEANSQLDLLRTLCDARTLACGNAYTTFSAAHPNDRETLPVK